MWTGRSLANGLQHPRIGERVRQRGRGDAGVDAARSRVGVTEELLDHGERDRAYGSWSRSSGGTRAPSPLQVPSPQPPGTGGAGCDAADQQEGVDTLIVRDVMVLSQERSIDRAMVLAGDEDLREGIEYAQDRVVLLTIVGIADRRGNTSQSIELRREAHEALALASTDLGTPRNLAPKAARARTRRPSLPNQPTEEPLRNL